MKKFLCLILILCSMFPYAAMAATEGVADDIDNAQAMPPICRMPRIVITTFLPGQTAKPASKTPRMKTAYSSTAPSTPV